VLPPPDSISQEDFDYKVELLTAFSHYSHSVTRGYLLVCDLQGIETTSGDRLRMLLTDPAIHCTAPRFGQTNLGQADAFFSVHTCNRFCRALRLQMPVSAAAPAAAAAAAAAATVPQSEMPAECRQS
jgi:hypothetical protein